MKVIRLTTVGLTVGALLGIAVWWGGRPAASSHRTPVTAPAGASFRIALVPEHDVFALRRSYQDIAAYLSRKLEQKVEIVTLHSYDAVLQEFQERQIDAAFLGAVVSVLAMDRLNARVLVKPQQTDGTNVYRGVIFVRDDSPVRSLDDLPGKTIAMVKTTLAGSLFPVAEMERRNLFRHATPPRIVWVGTHDDVIEAVLSGRVDVGAVKDLRLIAHQRSNPQWKIRQLAASDPVPNNALVVRDDVARHMGGRLTGILVAAGEDPDGRRALEALGAQRFVPCSADEYDTVYALAEAAGASWRHIGVSYPAPRRPGAATRPSTRTRP